MHAVPYPLAHGRVRHTGFGCLADFGPLLRRHFPGCLHASPWPEAVRCSECRKLINAPNEGTEREYSERPLKLLRVLPDFDSPMRRFESSRPSQWLSLQFKHFSHFSVFHSERALPAHSEWMLPLGSPANGHGVSGLPTGFGARSASRIRHRIPWSGERTARDPDPRSTLPPQVPSCRRAGRRPR